MCGTNVPLVCYTFLINNITPHAYVGCLRVSIEELFQPQKLSIYV